jgi:DNA polymerase III alpha subunit
MTSLLQQTACRDIDCLTAIVAIIRPGAANQGAKEVFARRHNRLEPPTYAHPSLRPVLENTYGLMVFEEHILQIATEFAGLNLGQADVLRRALNKENQPMIQDMGVKFVDSALAMGRSKEEIKAVWSLVAAFSGFMFNKAHSAEYAVEAFQGAWLKLRWPAHYLAAILSNYRGFYAHSPTLPQILYVMEALRRGIGFHPPCVNASRPRFSVECGCPILSRTGERLPDRLFIRIPVSHINGLSESFLERYRAAREYGPFASLDDFIARCRPGESEALSLLDAGALDSLGPSRPELFWRLRRLTRHPQGTGLFSEKRYQEAYPPDAPPIDLTLPDARQIAARETELLGFPVTLHPLDHLGTDDKGRRIDWSLYTPVDQLANYPNRRVHVCGLMVADRVSGTLNGGLLKFVTLADRTGVVETILFPDAYQRFGHLTAAHAILAATGIVEPFATGTGFTLRIQNVRPPTMTGETASPPWPRQSVQRRHPRR